MHCKLCYDPAPKGHDLCEWCAMTPEARRRQTVRDIIKVVCFVGVAIALIVSAAVK